jgi:hypothetical protein
MNKREKEAVQSLIADLLSIKDTTDIEERHVNADEFVQIFLKVIDKQAADLYDEIICNSWYS